MQTCSRCNATSPDRATHCVHCQADLHEFSKTAVALKKFRLNPRVKSVRVTVSYDACSHCSELLRTYSKDEVPALPHEGCSHENGCRCFYEPVLSEVSVI